MVVYDISDHVVVHTMVVEHMLDWVDEYLETADPGFTLIFVYYFISLNIIITDLVNEYGSDEYNVVQCREEFQNMLNILQFV